VPDKPLQPVKNRLAKNRSQRNHPFIGRSIAIFSFFLEPVKANELVWRSGGIFLDPSI
jgi:hypothetical protein